MVAEPWILRMGSQVSSNLKNSLQFQHQSSSAKRRDNSDVLNNGHKRKETIGILSFEVANVMSKIVHLHRSLSDQQIFKLKHELIKSEGVRNLISCDEPYLLELACAEKLDDLNRVGEIVSRLGSKCSEPALQRFEHVFGDLLNGAINVKELGFLVKDMDGMIRKLEKFVVNTSQLYCELEVLNDLEQAAKKLQQNHHPQESKRAIDQKLAWQNQDLRHLKDLSLWNQTYDKIVEFLARTVCTLYARISIAFGHGNAALRRNYSTKSAVSCNLDAPKLVKKNVSVRIQSQLDLNLFREQDFIFPCSPSPGRIFLECLTLSSATSRFPNIDDDDDDGCYSRNSVMSPMSKLQIQSNSGVFGAKSRSAANKKVANSTVGGSALALHYANVIIVLEKFLKYPHLIGEEARDDLYQMLPTSLRNLLNKRLKLCFKDVAIYDADVAHGWRERAEGVMRWLAPLAHNMMRWQGERSFEQQMVKRVNVLLLETLYFADREKTEGVICEVLVGLNYVCRYEQQRTALMNCGGSFDYGEWMEWQLECQASCVS